ncbi:MAG: DAK2 domain-containing protein [Patescibacteria group bacterium]
MITAIDSAKLKQIFEYAEELISSKEELLNNLNVYPVPDGDTGTNLSLTLKEVIKEIQKLNDPSIQKLCNVTSEASLMGARGNSGVILSQFIGGFCEAVDSNIDKKTLLKAFKNGQNEAYNSVSEPIEGTILTIMRSATEEIEKHQSYNSLEKIIKSALIKAQNTLHLTPDMLPKLKEAGVVDAGGAGFVYFLESFYQAVGGKELVTSTSSDDFTSPKLARVWDETVGVFGSGGIRSIIEFNIKVLKYTFSKLWWVIKQAFHILKVGKDILSFRKALKLFRSLGTQLKWENIKRANLSIFSLLQVWQKPPKERYCYEAILSDVIMSPENIMTKLSALGSSLIVAQKGKYTKIHFHLEKKKNIEKTLERIGAIEKMKIDDIHKQQKEFINRKLQTESISTETAVIAVVNSKNFENMFESFDGVHTVQGGPTMNPSIADLTQQINFVKSDNIIILPNNKNIFIGSRKAAEKSIKNVTVLETFDQAQGLSALLNFDPNSSLDTNKSVIREGLKLIKTFSVSKSIKDTKTATVETLKDEFFSISSNKIIASGKRLEEVIIQSIKSIIKNEQLITVYAGSDAPKKSLEPLVSKLSKQFSIEIQLQEGGQPHYHFIIAIE